ncbi:fumarylacetoacetate hydrolase family protein [Nonomuraea jabiensis]|uniref:fumarylacetoacetate hydrolase family protein n=1 Tax=Nonomuraea jabiensis TaxID=882448 RepID=UPI003D73EE83
MILLSVGDEKYGDSVAALIAPGELVDLRPLIGGSWPDLGFSPMRWLLHVTGGVPRFEAGDLEQLPRIPLDSVTIAPVVPDPSKIIAAPVNYRDHQAEMRAEHQIEGLGVFLKAPTSVLGHQGSIRLPYTDRRFDQEGELAVVIARRARNISVNDAAEVVAGYTCLLDITMRGGEDRSTRKSFDTFTPIGPQLVTPDEVGDPTSLRLRTTVNDTVRQDAAIADLIWDVPRLISYASSVMTLLPGDVISTGTPAGVGPLADGDRVSVDIDGVGTLSVSVSADAVIACPTRGAGHGPQPPAQITPGSHAECAAPPTGTTQPASDDADRPPMRVPSETGRR